MNDILLANMRSSVAYIQNRFVALDPIPTTCPALLKCQKKTHSDLSSPKYRRQYLMNIIQSINKLSNQYFVYDSIEIIDQFHFHYQNVLEHGVATVMSMWIFSFVSISMSGTNLKIKLLSK